MRSRDSFKFIALIISLVILIIFNSRIQTNAAENPIPFQPHPLPSTLEKWTDPNSQGDYFDAIETTKVGYLVWSKFPIQVYIEQPTDGNSSSDWYDLVASAVKEWNAYIPLQIIEQPEHANISIFRRRPPLEPGKTRASSAETRYRIFIDQTPEGLSQLSHQFTILLSPTQTGKYITAAIRHELGHGLGIWGHSPVETDTMYFSQVKEPPPISVRDVNTLKKIYQQPTRLGWPVVR